MRLQAHMPVDRALHVDEDHLARLKVVVQIEPAHLQRHALRSDHVLSLFALASSTEH